MKRRILNLSLLLSICFLITSLKAQQSALNPKLSNYAYLLGEFEVKVYLPDGNEGWKDGGEGTASYSTILEGTFIQENFAITIGNGTLTMNNILGIDPRTKELRLIALDKEYGTMDIYEGKIDQDTFFVSNLHSDARFELSNGDKLAFQLTYSPLTESSHRLLIEFTKDDGKSWHPYAKQYYIRKE